MEDIWAGIVSRERKKTPGLAEPPEDAEGIVTIEPGENQPCAERRLISRILFK